MPDSELERYIKTLIGAELRSGPLKFLIEESLRTGYLSVASLSLLQEEILDWRKLAVPDQFIENNFRIDDPILDHGVINFKDELPGFLATVDANTLFRLIKEASEKERLGDLLH